MSRGASMKNLVKGTCFHKKKIIQTMFSKRTDFDEFFFEIQTGLSFYSWSFFSVLNSWQNAWDTAPLNFTIMITVKRCRRLQYTVSWSEWALLVTWEKTNKKERNKCCFFSFQTELSISKQLCIESLKDFCFPHLRWGLFTIFWSFLCSVHTYNQSQYIYNKYNSKLLTPVDWPKLVYGPFGQSNLEHLRYT